MTIPTEVVESLNHLRGIVEFAYQQGFHELGYDPIWRIESALTKAEAVPVAWQSRYRYPLPNGGFAEWHEITKAQFEDREALPGHEKRALYAHASPADLKNTRLYHAANMMMLVVGVDGEIPSDAPQCTEMMAALAEIDGGQYKPAVPVESLGRDADTRLPDGYAYVYPANGGGETIRVGSNGREINGSTPIRAIPYYFDHPKQPVEPPASVPDGPIKVAATVRLYAGDVFVAEVSDPSLFSAVMTTILRQHPAYLSGPLATNQEGVAP